jgi:hypothetical protein
MTRLTDEVIEREWNECVTLRGDGVWYRRFASRIAALAVAEYRSREVANLLGQLAERENLLTAVMESRAETEAQLAEVTKERDRAVTRADTLRQRLAERIVAVEDSLDRMGQLRAQLAQVTKERDDLRVEVINLRDTRDALRAQLATAKQRLDAAMKALHKTRVTNVPWDGQFDYPATPSGQWCIRCGDTCKPWCHNATPSPEAREVERVGCVDRHGYLDIPVTQEVDSYIRITPADAKRIMDMAQRNI